MSFMLMSAHRTLTVIFPIWLVGVWGIGANMRPLAAQLRGHLFGFRYPAIVLERHPFPIRDHIKAERTVQLGLAPLGDAALAVAAAAASQVAKQLLVFVVVKFMLVAFVTGRLAERYSFNNRAEA
jgi:hypothetical protein